MKPDSNRPITIEDLLRLKRAERPPAEFWSTFDQELRAKQLAALVGKRPWWQNLPSIVSGLARYRVPLGATAVVAVTFFSVRSDRAAFVEPPETISNAPVAVQVVPEPVPAVPAMADAAYEPAAPVTPVNPEYVVYEDLVPAAPAPTMVAASVVQAVEEEPDALPLERGIAVAQESENELPAPRLMAARVVEGLDVLGAHNLLKGASGFEARVMPPERVAVEPLQKMRPPGEARRSRLLTAMVSQASMEASMRTTARAASRIEEERLYEQIRRFGARGDRVRIKF